MLLDNSYVTRVSLIASVRVYVGHVIGFVESRFQFANKRSLHYVTATCDVSVLALMMFETIQQDLHVPETLRIFVMVINNIFCISKVA